MLRDRKRRSVIVTVSDGIRRLVLSWLISAAVEYAIAYFPLSQLAGIREMSMVRMVAVMGISFAALNLMGLFYRSRLWERCLMVLAFLTLWIPSLIVSFRASYLFAGLLICLLMIPYLLLGQNQQILPQGPAIKSKKRWLVLTLLAAVAFFLFVSLWTVGRIMTFSSPSYDFGIFSQMFYYMRSTGLPLTTLERNGLLSHFCVHVSPIYYLLLPVYCLFPYPATLQIMQAAVLASAVIPLWLIARHYGFSGPWRAGFCLLLLFYPAFSGGTSYDIHENAFLTPLLLWLFYGIEKRNPWLTGIAAALTLLVKEDAAVYVAVIGLWLLVRGAAGRKVDTWQILTGAVLLCGALGWFFLVTGYLERMGQGIMTYRYDNFIADGSGSLVSVVKTVLLCPMKAVYECVDPDKLSFIALTMLPLLGIPLLTRRYERLILLIPYLLVNLMSDYRYQHDIFFQYTFGSTALLSYLTVVNLKDLYARRIPVFYKALPLVMALLVSGILFGRQVVPTAVYYPKTYLAYEDHYTQLRQLLDTVPENVSVSATTFYTTYLSQREKVYDVRYSSRDNTLNADYIVINPGAEGCLKDYGGYDAFVKLLDEHGYVLAEKGSGVEIYKKQVS